MKAKTETYIPNIRLDKSETVPWIRPYNKTQLGINPLTHTQNVSKPRTSTY